MKCNIRTEAVLQSCQTQRYICQIIQKAGASGEAEDIKPFERQVLIQVYILVLLFNMYSTEGMVF